MKFLFLICSIALVKLSAGDLTRRIINGTLIGIKKAPYQVAIRRSDKVRHWCGGSLISEEYVLSAAHCFPPGHKYFVKVGSSNRNGGVNINVDEYVIHPEYNESNLIQYDYDFAIVKLASSPKLPSVAEFVQLPAAGDQYEAGEKMLVSGFGDTRGVKDIDLLRALEVPVVDQKVCYDLYKINGDTVSDRMLCAGYIEGGKDSCQGDSGGPMVRLSDKVLVGVVSWGVGCAEPDFPGVYSKVSSVRNWIKEISGV